MLDNCVDDLMSIVVLEAGASWPPWLTEYQRLAPNAVVIAQARSEGAEAFRGRVVHRIAEGSALGAQVRVGVIVSAGAVDPETLKLREGVARAIVSVMGTQAEAELVIAGDGQEGDALRHELFELAGALCEELGGTGVSVRVRFTSTARSGVMRSVVAAEAEQLTAEVASKGKGA